MRSEQPATPELQLLRYLVTVADEGGMTRAARRLHLTQQALSSGIKRLETVARVSLVDRVDPPGEPDPAGEVFVVRARRALAEAEHAVADAQAVSRGGSGRLVVGVAGGGRHRPRVARLLDTGRAPWIRPRPLRRHGHLLLGLLEAVRAGLIVAVVSTSAAERNPTPGVVYRQVVGLGPCSFALGLPGRLRVAARHPGHRPPGTVRVCAGLKAARLPCSGLNGSGEHLSPVIR